MREIKFRAWDKKGKGFINGFNLIGFSGGQGSPEKRLQRFNTYWDIDDVELMQYTGLKDKNGKEIYEGDIVTSSWSPNRKEVVAIETISHFDGGFSHLQGIGFTTEMSIDNLEVIGNKFENKDLFE